MVLESAKNTSSARAFAVSASEAAALAAAASEKYRAALELDEDETFTSVASATKSSSDGCFTAETRARAFVDWGDALRLAASASADALAASSGAGFEAERGEAFFFDAARLPPPGRNFGSCQAGAWTSYYQDQARAREQKAPLLLQQLTRAWQRYLSWDSRSQIK